METLDDVDLFFLSKFQSFADWFKHQFGWNNFFLAKLFLALATFLWISRGIYAVTIGGNFTFLKTSILFTFTGNIGFLFVIYIKERFFESNFLVSKFDRKPRVSRIYVVTILFFLFILIMRQKISGHVIPDFPLWYQTVSLIEEFLILCAWYFSYCVPKAGR